jgi:hypothetical protein
MDFSKPSDASNLDLNKTQLRAYLVLEEVILNSEKGAVLIDDNHGKVHRIVDLFAGRVIGAFYNRLLSRPGAIGIVKELEKHEIIGRPDDQPKYSDSNLGEWYVRMLHNLSRNEAEYPIKRPSVHPVAISDIEIDGMGPRPERDVKYVGMRIDLFDFLIEKLSEEELQKYYESHGFFIDLDEEALVTPEKPPFHIHFEPEDTATEPERNNLYSTPDEYGWMQLIKKWMRFTWRS